MTPLYFASEWLGRVAKSPGGLGGECVDLANVYIMERFGFPEVFRNAVDWAQLRLSGFSWTPNNPTNMPAPGSIVVWGKDDSLKIGVNGHIAVVLASDLFHMATLDQNWRVASVTLELHSYQAVLGWHRRG